MTPRKRGLKVAAGMAAALTLVVTGGPAAGRAPVSVAAHARTASAGWAGQLAGVSADSATDAWAVGSDASTALPIILHWNGLSLAPVVDPVPGGQANLFGVSALSPTQVWVVGSQSLPGVHRVQTLVLRWDGSQWSTIPSPHPSPFFSALQTVRVLSPADVWVTGYSIDPSTHRHMPLILRWDGSAWSTVPLPPKGNVVDSVDTGLFDPISTTSAFAVVRQADRAGRGIESDQIWHWDGRKWLKSPLRFIGDALYGISADSNGDAWAVGYFCLTNRCPPFQTLALHRNGRRWKYSPTPLQPGCKGFVPRCRGDSQLVSVTARSPSDVWAAGHCRGSCAHGTNIVLRWDGHSWSQVASPPVALSSAISPVSANDAWAVGAGGTQLLHWNGTAWSAVSP